MDIYVLVLCGYVFILLDIARSGIAGSHGNFEELPNYFPKLQYPFTLPLAV